MPLPQSVPLKQRVIQVEIETFETRFSGGGNRRIYLGAAIDCQTKKCGLPSLNECTLEIYNIAQEDVDLLSTKSPIKLNMKRNEMTVKAGDAGTALSVVFQGEIYQAYGTWGSPDRGIHIEAMAGIFAKGKPASPTTHEGSVSGKGLIKELAEHIGYTFEDNGFPDVQITDPVLNGSELEQIINMGRYIGGQIIVDDKKIVLSPPEKGIGAAVEIAPPPHGNLLGYPFFSPTGVSLNNLYSPKFRQGGYIHITKSGVPNADGLWKVVVLNHHLQCFGAGDAWDSYIEGIYV